MRKIFLAGVLSTISFAAMAQWSTGVEDDIFTGGKKATMIASIGDYDGSRGLIFDCTKSELSFAYIERSNEPDKVAKIPVDMFIKVDSGEIIKTKSGFDQRNDKYIQVGIDDKDVITQILKESAKAKSKIIVGISSDITGKNSVTASVSGSSKAINQFVTACEIKL